MDERRKPSAKATSPASASLFYLLPLSAVVIGLLYAGVQQLEPRAEVVRRPDEGPKSAAPAVPVAPTKPTTPTKPSPSKQPPTPSRRVADEPEQTFLDRFNQTRLADFVSLRRRDRSVPEQRLGELRIDDVNRFIRVQLLPRLNSIVGLDYFRYIKLNLNRQCSLWPDDTRCSLRDCSIQKCDESHLPGYLRSGDEHELLATHPPKPSAHAPPSLEPTCDQGQMQLQRINMSLPSGQESTMNSIFECYVTEYEDGQYYDLQINPERFTGYAGHSSHRIWKSIYEENCFRSSPLYHQFINPLMKDESAANPILASLTATLDSVPPVPTDPKDLCFEERFFYKAISGLHSSINLHLCSYYHFKDGSIGYNLDEFVRRFSGKEDYLRNLYFVFMLEWRALQKVEQYLMSRVNWQSSGDQQQTREAIRNLLQTSRQFQAQFDDRELFGNQQFLSSEFAQHFRNISTTIMDCVACDKCRLWGKLQIHALGTTFKILLSDLAGESAAANDSTTASAGSFLPAGGQAATGAGAASRQKFHLHRHEISTLINGITRLSTSIHNLSVFNRLLKGLPEPPPDRPAYKNNHPPAFLNFP